MHAWRCFKQKQQKKQRCAQLKRRTDIRPWLSVGAEIGLLPEVDASFATIFRASKSACPAITPQCSPKP